jgi:hypothetical protein
VIEVGGNGASTISTPDLQLAVNGYASFSSPFATAQEIVDSLGNVQALFWKDGAMEPKLNATSDAKGPYKQPKDAFGRAISALSLLATSGGIQTNAPGLPVYVTIPAGNGDNNRADWWFTTPYGSSGL